jgi:hypothetical protein
MVASLLIRQAFSLIARSKKAVKAASPVKSL